MRNCEEKKRIVTKGEFKHECYIHEGKRFTNDWWGRDHDRKGKIRGGSVQVIENETEENRHV